MQIISGNVVRDDRGAYRDGLAVVSKDGTVKVEWVNLGEGWAGDYNPNDSEDDNLLRFDVCVLRDGDWVDPGDASYCTQMPARESDEVLIQALKEIVGEVSGKIGHHKKILENLSWIGPKGVLNG